MTNETTTNANRFKGLANERRLNAHPATRTMLEAITDPWERYVKACELATKHYRNNTEMEALRHKRRTSFIVLHTQYRVAKMAIGRLITPPELAAEGKWTDRRITDFGPRVADEGTAAKLPKWSKEQALQIARETHAEMLEREAIGTVAREFRRVLILEFTGGKYGESKSNAELARVAGISSAAMAQIRTGTVNAPAEVKRARKRRKEEEQAAANAEGDPVALAS